MSWPLVALGDVVDFRRATVSAVSIASGTTYVGLEHITGEGAFEGVGDVQQGELGSSKFAFSPEHVLFGKLRPYLKKIARPGFSGVCSTDILPLRPKAMMDRDYLFHILRRQEFIDLVAARSAGANLPRIAPDVLAELAVPLPPLAEQRRIAAILDKADALRAKRREAIAKLDQLLQSVFLDMFGDPVTNPKGWPCADLRQVTTKIGSGATPAGGDESYQTSGISLIRSLNVHDSQFRWAKLAFIDEDQAYKLRNVVVEAGDVLLNITGASVARVCRAPAEVLPARVNQHVSIIRCGRLIAPQYLEHALMNPSMKGKLLGVAESGATRQAITKAEIERLEIPLPPIEIQNQFSAIVGQIACQRKLFGDESKGIESMFAALQDRAFSGTL